MFYKPVDDLVDFDQEPDLWRMEICGGIGVHKTKLKENWEMMNKQLIV